ncbi:MAG: hypothetical protein JW932_08115 [Deltaproteobacteria bacterium]|nr:hypothetical protein [Deltaproteobacteria bacterium]
MQSRNQKFLPDTARRQQRAADFIHWLFGAPRFTTGRRVSRKTLGKLACTRSCRLQLLDRTRGARSSLRVGTAAASIGPRVASALSSGLTRRNLSMSLRLITRFRRLSAAR